MLLNILRAGLVAEKLEWGNSDQVNQILERYPRGFDLVLGADIYILIDIFPLEKLRNKNSLHFLK